MIFNQIVYISRIIYSSFRIFSETQVQYCSLKIPLKTSNIITNPKHISSACIWKKIHNGIIPL